MYLLRPITPATTGPVLMPTRDRPRHLDAVGHAARFHAAGEVHGVTPQIVDVLAAADHACNHGAGIDADPELHDDVILERMFARDVDHTDRHAHHALGVVLDRLGQAAHRHVGVAHGLDFLDADLLGRHIE